MDFTEFLENFNSLFEDTDVSTISGDTIFRDLDEWDSLFALSVIAMADEVYQIKLTGEDIRTSVKLQDLFEKIKGKI